MALVCSLLSLCLGIDTVKGTRSIRQRRGGTFSTELAVGFIAMATSEKLKASAEYIGMVDGCVGVNCSSNNNSYANVDIFVDIAERCGVHSVCAGPTRLREPPGPHDPLANTRSFRLVSQQCGEESGQQDLRYHRRSDRQCPHDALVRHWHQGHCLPRSGLHRRRGRYLRDNLHDQRREAPSVQGRSTSLC